MMRRLPKRLKHIQNRLRDQHLKNKRPEGASLEEWKEAKRLKWMKDSARQRERQIAATQRQRARKKGQLKCEPKPAPPELPKKWIKDTYQVYLQSDWWKWKRKIKLDSQNHECERCPQKAIQVHHKHYRSLGREKNKDLEALCRSCHEKEHNIK